MKVICQNIKQTTRVWSLLTNNMPILTKSKLPTRRAMISSYKTQRLGSIGWDPNRYSPILQKVISDSFYNDTEKTFKFGSRDVINRSIYEVKNKKKAK